MVKNISLLGSTGSIGRNVLEVVRQYPDRFRVVGLAAGRNLSLLREQIDEFAPELVSLSDPVLAGELSRSLPPAWRNRVMSGPAGNERVAVIPAAEMVVSAIVGAAGLTPTLAAIRAGKDIGLANKETLVMAGDLVMQEVRRHKVRLLPIDSEHSAINQGLDAGRREDVARLILTASGGPFFATDAKELDKVTPEQALAHPNWDMGDKISIDSATLMNKGLEVIEARYLFDIEVDRIEVLVHPQSIVHSMVEYRDGSFIAHLGIPDMKIPIAYALAFPERLELNLPRLDLAAASLEFHQPDLARFPALGLAYEVCLSGGVAPAVFNAANEVAVAAFLDRRISFTGISKIVAETVSQFNPGQTVDLDTILTADRDARIRAELLVDSVQFNLHN
ncbi:MAG: 1-deoxy-D-xylulose-5-phosphate reductoisomerase [Desulfurivibrionaceae bacterium]|nr:1-deoxy-D-xylulose-5-phosphate reductoisomerase [Desulfobulbales bacterium]MDT8334199.1 1-deoxy-D-xylulose-5-phosphate reductoisomerase [Desulfurivibrionaceae bacterium]